MPIGKIVTGEEEREFNGPLKPPLFTGGVGTRKGQIAYDAAGILDGAEGPVYWDGVQWLKYGIGGFSYLDNVAALRGVSATYVLLNKNVSTLGYTNKGDGGHGQYYWDAASTATDNGGSIIKVTAIATGRFRLLGINTLNVLQWGADASGTADSATAFNNVLAAGAISTSIVIPSGTYRLNSSITINTAYQSIIGYGLIRPTINLYNGATINITNQYNTFKSLSIFSIGTTSTHGLRLFTATNSDIEDIYVSGTFTTAAIHHDANCYGTLYRRVQANNINIGDGWLFSSVNSNAIVGQKCFSTNIIDGLGIRATGCNGMVIHNWQFENCKLGGLGIVATALQSAEVRGLEVHGLYAETSSSLTSPVITIIQTGGAVTLDLKIIGGYANCYNFSNFADFSGITTGTANVYINNVTVVNVASAAYVVNDIVRGKIESRAPFNASTNVDQNFINGLTINSRINVVQRSFFGREQHMQPINLGPDRANLKLEGALWYNASDLLFRDALPSDIFVGRDNTYIDQTATATLAASKSNIHFNCGSGSGDITLTLPLANSVRAGRLYSFKKTVAAFLVNLQAGAGNFIEASAAAGSISLSTLNSSVILVSNGSTRWRIIASHLFASDFGDGVTDTAGNGSPEGVVTAAPSSTYRQKDGTPGNLFWNKQSGTGNTGWAPIA